MTVNSIGVKSNYKLFDFDSSSIELSQRLVIQEFFNNADLKVEPITKCGSGDSLYYIFSGFREYVLRIGDYDVETFSALTEFASDHDFGPKFVNKNIEKKALLTEFVAGSPLDPSHLEDPEIIKQFADKIKILHGSPSELHSISKIDRAVTGLRENGGFPEVVNAMEVIIKEIALCNFSGVPCHNDLHPGNLIFDHDKKIKLIDWGDAGSGDPFYDLARVSIEFVFGPKQCSIFLDQYFGQLQPLEGARFYLMRQLVLVDRGASLLLRTLCNKNRPVTKDEKKRILLLAERGILLPCEESPHLDLKMSAELLFKTFLQNAQSKECEESIAILKNHQKL